jgi:triphosphoribosyl-dephospho-CoA synthetase
LLQSSNPSTKKLQKRLTKEKTIQIYKAINISGRRALREETQDERDNPEDEDEEEAPATGTENNGSREI